VSHEFLKSIVPRIVELLKYFSPDLLPLSDAVGTLLPSIREKIPKSQYNSLEEIIGNLINAFTERQSLKNSLRGRYGQCFFFNRDFFSNF
jgi:hypothetical protein